MLHASWNGLSSGDRYVRPSSAGQYTVVKRFGVGIAPTVLVLVEESVETLSKVMGKFVTADTELGFVLSPVGVARDVLGSVRGADCDNVGKIRDCVREFENGSTELDIRLVRPEVWDKTGEVTDALGALDNELGFE